MLTKSSKDFISFFMKNNCLSKNEKITNNTKNVFLSFYDKLKDAKRFIKTFQKNIPSIIKIRNEKDIPRPKTYHYIPKEVIGYIHKKSYYCLTYSFQLFQRDIKIYFIIEEDDRIEQYNEYVDRIIMWLYIIQKNVSNKCSMSLNIYLYLSSHVKVLPIGRSDAILDLINVNTAYTFSCKTNNDLVIYRKEEWFKVFIHETFHSFGLDFSFHDSDISRNKILELFHVNSEVKLYEAYTEFWARMMNILFISYFYIEGKQEFINQCKKMIYLEQLFSIFQMVKVLNYMNLDYKQLTENSNIKKLQYKENTNILSYYIITCNLLFCYQDFLLWCCKNNKYIIEFTPTDENQLKLCSFIQEKYKINSFLKSIHCIQSSFIKVPYYLNNTLRMTIFELK